MAPRKKRGKKKPTDKDISPDGNDSATAPLNIPRLEFTRQYTNDDGSPGAREVYYWTAMKKYLKDQQSAMERTRSNWTKQVQWDLLDIGGLQAEFNRTKGAYENALDAEKEAAKAQGKKSHGGRSDDAKAAKAAHEPFKTRLAKVKAVTRNGRSSREVRSDEHYRLAGAQWRLEDFLYYQDSMRRWKRWRYLNPDPAERAAYEAERSRTRISYKLQATGGDGGYEDWMRYMLNYYDRREIGGQRYQSGHVDRLGNVLRDLGTTTQRPQIGSEELHMWTPRPRRWHSGLPPRIGVDENGVGEMIDGVEQFHYADHPREGDINLPINLNLNLEEIEKERSKHDDVLLKDSVEKGLGYATHTERRELETARFAGSRPSTLALNSIRSFEGAPYADRWGEMRTDQGLFIAAKELSWDWLTSFDCLDKVRPADYPTILPISAVRDEILSSDDDDGGDEDEKDRDPMIRGSVPGARKDSETQEHLENSDSSQTPETRESEEREQEDGIKNSEAPVEEVQLRRKRNASPDYPYLKHEFCRKKRARPNDGEHRIDITSWAEETDGRREWHVYKDLSPVSEVYSPPRSPIDPGQIDPASLPPTSRGFDSARMWQVDDQHIKPLEDSRRRCKLTNECRAWWPHPAAECWVAYSKISQGRDDGSNIDPPEMPLHMAEGGVAVYHARISDHYGIKAQTNSEARWPALGIRVPYTPMTFDDRRGNLPETTHDANATSLPKPVEIGEPQGINKSTSSIPHGFEAQDASHRHAYEFHSMTVPIVKEPQEPWSKVDAEPATGPSDDESDDGGDIFHASYEEGPLPNPAPSNPSSNGSMDE
ncbi:hypothetical protein HBH70_187850 [Parastagonospora nodorum]|nr:hypothetical protein HBI95_197070 [Parastagonospora nodorum]KAH4952720.1 hypothetical protein HBI78_236270 [Parastagonospora nodorum]KAH5130722.1 hypothetical protein HBH70_187850 [Parastagonospora nodorum]KAH5147791.1 hypothetical protein HBH69_166510 [Parastagonospora nodorum]KAH5173502.1 hypothetical protein HBH77_208480 [Parastagonospora nodorum]